MGESGSLLSGSGGRRMLLGRLTALACVLVLAAAGVAVAENFGPIPKPDISRCSTTFKVSKHILVIGEILNARTGPATPDCGGPSTTVHWAWPPDTADPSQTQTPGLVETHPCPGTSSHCQFKAVMYTQHGIWQAVAIAGSSPQGGWGASDYYAVLTQNYHELYGVTGKPGVRRVTVSGPDGRQTLKTLSNGTWYLAVRPGTYTASWVPNHKTVRRTVKVTGKPGTAVEVGP
jgi:hypothetical protein